MKMKTLLAFIALTVLALAGFNSMQAQTLDTLVNFELEPRNPYANVIQGSDGNFYGTTSGFGFGASDYGTVFKMTPAGGLTTLVSFTDSTGRNPVAGLVQGSDGNFYGTTAGGGALGGGTIFRISFAAPERPLLSVIQAGANVTISWPVAFSSFMLEESNLSPPPSWKAAPLARATNAGIISVSLPVSAGNKFFRLKQ